MRHYLLICLYAFIFPSSAADTSGLALHQSVQTWIHENKGAEAPLVIHYYWATWCGPCTISAQQLSEVKNKLKDKVTIYAYSDEPLEVIEKHLLKKFPKKNFPFHYAKIISKKMAPASELSHNVSSLPFLFICLLYTSPSPRDRQKSRMPSSA